MRCTGAAIGLPTLSAPHVRFSISPQRTAGIMEGSNWLKRRRYNLFHGTLVTWQYIENSRQVILGGVAAERKSAVFFVLYLIDLILRMYRVLNTILYRGRRGVDLVVLHGRLLHPRPIGSESEGGSPTLFMAERTAGQILLSAFVVDALQNVDQAMVHLFRGQKEQ